MDIDYYVNVQSEITTLERILANLDDDAVIERIGYEYRLKKLKKYLEQLEHTVPKKTLNLTFRGEPVVGSQAVRASFASKATDLFSDAYDMVVAALNGSLIDAISGPIVDREKYELLLSDVAVGSFGFQFQLPQTENELAEERPITERAILQIEKILKTATQKNDEDIADLIDTVPPRAIKKIYSFLEQLEKNKAWCGLSFESNTFQFKDFKQLQFAAKQLKEDNILEKVETFTGALKGFLPSSKVFEFAVAETGEVIKGKVDRQIEHPELLNTQWLNKAAEITCKLIAVGKGKPRYTLISIKAPKQP